MSAFSTSTWGYKILSENKINFYHVLLSKINLQNLYSSIPTHRVKQQKDGSITISLLDSVPSLSAVDKIISFFQQKEQEFFDTPNYYYQVSPRIRTLLPEWALAFEGCIGLLLTKDKDLKDKIFTWQLINSPVGGIYLEPFTLLFYEDRPKIMHPISVQNYEFRKLIEQKTASYIRKIVKNINQAQPGLEGIALTSFVEAKTNLSQKEIGKVINEKTLGIQTPKRSLFFSPLL